MGWIATLVCKAIWPAATGWGMLLFTPIAFLAVCFVSGLMLVAGETSRAEQQNVCKLSK